jgi:translocation and assembly module TamA
MMNNIRSIISCAVPTLKRPQPIFLNKVPSAHISKSGKVSLAICIQIALYLCSFSLSPSAFAQAVTLITVKTSSSYQAAIKLDVNPDDEVDINEIRDLLKQHTSIQEAAGNMRLNKNEWLRLVRSTPSEINALLATLGYFSSRVTIDSLDANKAELTIQLNTKSRVSTVNLVFTGEITGVEKDQSPSVIRLTESWRLPKGSSFSQAAWSQAKRELLSSMLTQRFPNAKIKSSQAKVNPKTNEVTLNLTIASGPSVRFGQLKIEGLEHYQESLIHNINPIKPGDVYNQNQLFILQSNIQETGKFSRVNVRANTQQLASDQRADIVVSVNEFQQKNVSVGVGASTNTGARIVLNYTDLNLFQRGLLWKSSLRLEQRLQAATSNINFITDARGYRDSINNNLVRTDIEGQVTTAINNGLKRSWGNRNFEQFVGANLLYEFLTIDNETTEFNKAATFAYGLSVRKLDNDFIPTKGVIFSSQLQFAPLESISDGRFVQSQAKVQVFYPLGESTQFLGRLEGGMIAGSEKVPATYLFRAGGDQSVRGYGFQTLGVKQGDAVLGGRVLLTGSGELVQWLTPAWGAAAFIDFGNAAEAWRNYEPVYGYGLGARWKSPVGPVGVDIAYGEDTQDYRLHFNLGVSF